MATYASKARDGFLANDITASGVITASGGVTGDLTGNVTGNVTGNLIGNITPVAVTAEHGAGAIGTGVAPATYRWQENGTIITEIKIDLTGLASVATQDDIIGLAAGTPPAYIGRNVVANNGVIYRIEMICLETPAGGDNDINLVSGSAATEKVGDAVTGASVKINGGDQVAGIVTVNDVPAVTANHYLYLTAGTGDTADTYTAGQFIVRLYGHALLA